ncbi:MAG: zinc ribbon domain-containing protein [Candidatus Dadabacteria bacterium]|nr:MAG: zinc ribbon domain-containing protein [Candidatus Dadabacteria bacterium]
MPIYEYEREDGTRFEIMQKISDEPLTKCPTTGQAVKRVISETSFILKGSGWYKTDYASSNGANGSSSKNGAKAKSDSSSESKSGSSGCGKDCACAKE